MNWTRPKTVLALVAVLLSGLLLPACGDKAGSNPPPGILITIQAEPLGTVLPGCQPGELEDWYELAGSLVMRFRDESLAALDGLPDTLVPTLLRLSDLRDAIASQPVPECAVLAHNTILIHLRQSLDAFQSYSAGTMAEDALRAEVRAAANAISTTVADLLENTRIQLETGLSEQRATQAASTP